MKNRKYLFALPIFALAGIGVLVSCGGSQPSATVLLDAEVDWDDESVADILIDNKTIFAGQAYETKITLIETEGEEDPKNWKELPSGDNLKVYCGKKTELDKALYTYEVDNLDHKTAVFSMPKKSVDIIAKLKSSEDKELWLQFDGDFPEFNYGVVVEGVAPDGRKDYEIDLVEHSISPGSGAYSSDLIFTPNKVHTPERILSLPTNANDFEVSVGGKIDKSKYYVNEWNIASDNIDKGSITLTQACSEGNVVIKVNLYESDPLLTFTAASSVSPNEIDLTTDQVREGDSYVTDIVLKQEESSILELPANGDKIEVTYVSGSATSDITGAVYERDAVDHSRATFSISAEILKDLQKGKVSIEFPELKPLQFPVVADLQEKEDLVYYEVESTAILAPAGKDFDTVIKLKIKPDEEPINEKTLPENYYLNKDKIKFYVGDKEITSFTDEEAKSLWALKEEPQPGSVAEAECKIPAKYVTGSIRIVVTLIPVEK